MILWHNVFFLLMALIACGFAVAVVLTGNIVRMAFYLVISLGAVAGLFFLAGAQFVGAMQLMIYVGGTVVLLIFGVMLTARSPFVNMKTPAGQWAAALAAGGALLAILAPALWSVGKLAETPAPAAAEGALPDASRPADVADASQLGLGLVGVRSDALDENDPTLRAGMSGYLLPFEIISVHLVAVLVGAAYLARAKRRAAGTKERRVEN